MKKLLVVLGLAMAAFSFQASASAVSWTSVPALGTPSVIGPQLLFGDYDNSLLPGSLNNAWDFSLDVKNMVLVDVREFRDADFNIGVYLDTLLMTQGPSGTWSFAGVLAAGTHTIGIIGNVLTQGEIDLRVETFKGNEVPVPAAVWLFGSALMGLMGASRRKSAQA